MMMGSPTGSKVGTSSYNRSGLTAVDVVVKMSPGVRLRTNAKNGFDGTSKHSLIRLPSLATV